MIASIEVRNFRCFDRLTLEGLGRINVVVGESASGKTALLEAISLGMGGSPDLPMRFRTWRGLGQLYNVVPTRASYESLWQDLFYQLDQRRTISISLRGAAETTRSLEIGYRPQTPATVAVSGADSSNGVSGPLDSSLITPITLEWTDANNEKHTYHPNFTAGSILLGLAGFPSQSAFFSSAFMASVGPTEAANQFSEFSKKKKADPIRKALKSVFPSIDDVSVENNAGTSMLYCSVPWMTEKVPVALVSSGINKLLVILLGIATMTKGVVQVDELENGIYYKTYPDVWRSLLHFCLEFDAQAFVSTHSMECLRATLPALRKNEEHFRLLRCERKGRKRIVRVFQGKDFEAAMEGETEVR